MNKYRSYIFAWLITGCVLILAIVIIGGITRLTQSGLSIVDWKPITGTIPPITDADWDLEFAKYQASPEFQKIHVHFQLADYKRIYFWEYFHRLIARFIGLVFLLPALMFWFVGALDKKLQWQVIVIFLGGAFQGFLGWYMVKSGLVDIPHVSHIRLAAHLITAFGLMAYIFSVALDVKRGDNHIKNTASHGYWFLGLLILQIIYGAFVAGLKAGKYYNTFPKMGNSWFPDELLVEYDRMGLLAIVESAGIVQFIHRYLGIAVLMMAIYIFAKSRKQLNYTRVSGIVLVSLVCVQVLLGIITLLYAVPIFMGVAHQFVAALVLLSTVHYIKSS